MKVHLPSVEHVPVTEVPASVPFDVACLIGLRVGSGRNAKVQVFSLKFDGLSPSGALIGSPTVLGTF